jgi:hypothetical protein
MTDKKHPAGPVEMTLNRDFILATTQGHRIRFVRGVPVPVPRAVLNEALAIGATPAEELPPEEEKKSDEPIDPVEREIVLFDAFRKLLEGGKREDFTASGAPHHKAVSDLVGFRVQAKEVNPLWQKYQEAQAQE